MTGKLKIIVENNWKIIVEIIEEIIFDDFV